MADVTEARDRGWAEVRGASEDRSSGSAEIARRAAEALAALPASDLVEAVRTLVTAHPSMAALWRLGSAVLSADVPGDAASAFASVLAEEPVRVAAAARGVLPDRVVVHSLSSTVIRAVAAAAGEALCGRSDPGGEGREAARRLGAAGVRATVVEDREAIRAAAQGIVVVVGADAVGPGGVINKVGTTALAEAARRGGGAYVLAGATKLVAEDLPAPHPFERTPLELFTAIVGERGPVDPRTAARRAVSHPLHPELRPLLARP
jgi:translation initiation factor 2B subunit (eIF-2B alpha/beta/delta family)